MPAITNHADRLDTCSYLGMYIITERPGRQKDKAIDQGDEGKQIIIWGQSAHLSARG